jgi:hypothetical protein
MSASTVPPKKQSWLDERRCEEAGAIKQKIYFLSFYLRGQREALLLLRKRTVSAKEKDLAER